MTTFSLEHPSSIIERNDERCDDREEKLCIEALRASVEAYSPLIKRDAVQESSDSNSENRLGGLSGVPINKSVPGNSDTEEPTCQDFKEESLEEKPMNLHDDEIVYIFKDHCYAAVIKSEGESIKPVQLDTEIKEELPAEGVDQEEFPCITQSFVSSLNTPQEIQEGGSHYHKVSMPQQKQFPSHISASSSFWQQMASNADANQRMCTTNLDIRPKISEFKFFKKVAHATPQSKDKFHLQHGRISPTTKVGYSLNETQVDNTLELKDNVENFSKNNLLPCPKKVNLDYKCHVCGKEFGKNRHRFSSHMLSHSNIRSYSCDICSRGFVRKFSLKRHKLIHTRNNLKPRDTLKLQKSILNNNSTQLSETNKTNVSYICSHCGKVCDSKRRLSEHMLSHSNVRPHRCEICGKGFKQKSHLTTHSSTHNRMFSRNEANLPFKCHVCGKGFTEESRLSRHVNDHSVIKPYTCNVCGKSFRQVSNLYRHLRAVHGASDSNLRDSVTIFHNYSQSPSVTKKANIIYKCPVCGKELSRKYRLTVHMLSHNDVKPHICEICGKGFTERYILKKHKLIHSGGKTKSKTKTKSIDERNPEYKCSVCGLVFSKKRRLTTHMISHKEDRPYSCDVCGKSYKTKQLANRHRIIHSRVNSHNCNLCNKSFKLLSYLKTHIKIFHNDERPHTCDICGKRFKQNFELKSHSLIHGDEKRYMCEVCGALFRFGHSLTDHKVIHTGEKLYKCDLCQESFGHKRALTCHLRDHLGIKPYKCNVCRKTFRVPHHLTNHLKIHSNGKPFQCKVCGKTFKSSSDLSSHNRSHSSRDKPFRCDLCPRSFSIRRHLMEHSGIHTGEKIYKCDICNMSFRTSPSFYQHRLSHKREGDFKCGICVKAFTTSTCLARHVASQSHLRKLALSL